MTIILPEVVYQRRLTVTKVVFELELHQLTTLSYGRLTVTKVVFESSSP